MRARDSNNATWYVLRYADDFAPRAGKSETRPYPPQVETALFYDDRRQVMELLPKRPAREVAPLPGIAVDVDGQMYRVDPATGELRVRRCDGSEIPVTCEPGVFADPAGLALDRRGFLYVADPSARRVVVILPEDGHVVAVLDGGRLREGVDVAVAPTGRVYVADRGGRDASGVPQSGRIAMFSARFSPAGEFEYQLPARTGGQPPPARPVAVMVDADGTILVADAHHPRLLRFDGEGRPLADEQLSALVGQLAGGDVALSALERAYGKQLPRFVAGACSYPFPARDGGARIADIHRAVRLLALSLGRAFEATGVFVSAVLDSGRPGTVWHRIEVDAELPPGTWLTLETATADDAARLGTPHTVSWDAARDPDKNPVPVTASLPDQLIQSPPGRYLRLRVALFSQGRETPSLRAVRIRYPRASYLDLLPRIYRRDAEGALFLERFLALFERVLTGVEDRYEAFSHELNPDAAPREVVDWLACLIDLGFDPSWPIQRRRALVAAAMDLFRRRGTVEGIRRYVEIYTGIRPLVVEAFLQRPARPALLGRGSVLGCSLGLSRCEASTPPAEQLFRDYAHRFTVLVYLDDRCDRELVLPVVDRIVSVNKPAHTVHTICAVLPQARVGLQSQVGMNFVLGGREAPHTRLGEKSVSGVPQTGTGVLGVNSVLGQRRPQYVRH